MVGTVPILRLNFATHLLGNETDLRYIPHFISFFARVTNIFLSCASCVTKQLVFLTSDYIINLKIKVCNLTKLVQ